MGFNSAFEGLIVTKSLKFYRRKNFYSSEDCHFQNYV